MENDVPIPRGTSILDDGGDKIQASFPIAITRGAYPDNPGSLLAGAVEVLSTDNWGTSFTAPIGENTGNVSTFEYTAIYVMAAENGTEIFINGNLNGTINAGEDLVINDIVEGDVITSDKPVQADILTGDVGSTYELRWYSLIPTEDWGNEYYTPVGDNSDGNENGPTRVFVYNPGASAITVSYDFFGGASPDGTFSVPVGASARSPAIPDGSGAKFYTDDDDDIFFALTVTDVEGEGDFLSGEVYDWGHPLIPRDQLTNQALIGWGYGCTDGPIPCTTSRGVVWVTPVADATISIDFNGNGTVDNTVYASALQSMKIVE